MIVQNIRESYRDRFCTILSDVIEYEKTKSEKKESYVQERIATETLEFWKSVMDGPEAVGDVFVENYAQMLGITCTLYDQDVLQDDCMSSIITGLLPSPSPIQFVKEAYRVLKTHTSTAADPRKSNAVFAAYTLLYFIGDKYDKSCGKGYDFVKKLRLLCAKENSGMSEILSNEIAEWLTQSDDGDECSICFEGLLFRYNKEFKIERGFDLTCGHNQFHYMCIAKWVVKTKKPACPLCK